MAITSTKITASVTDQLWKITSLEGAAGDEVENLFSGSGTLYSFIVDVPGDGQTIYVRMADTDSVTPGSTAPEILLPIGVQSKRTVIITGGLAFSNLSVWGTTANTEASAADPSAITLLYLVLR